MRRADCRDLDSGRCGPIAGPPPSAALDLPRCCGIASRGRAVMVHSRRHELAARALWLWVVIAMFCTAATGFIEGPGDGALSSSGAALATIGAALSLMCYGVFAAYVVFPLASVAVSRPPTLAIFGGFGTMAMAHVWIVTDRPAAQLVMLAVIAGLSAVVTVPAVAVSARAFRSLGRSAEWILGWAASAFARSAKSSPSRFGWRASLQRCVSARSSLPMDSSWRP